MLWASCQVRPTLFIVSFLNNHWSHRDSRISTCDVYGTLASGMIMCWRVWKPQSGTHKDDGDRSDYRASSLLSYCSLSWCYLSSCHQLIQKSPSMARVRVASRHLVHDLMCFVDRSCFLVPGNVADGARTCIYLTHEACIFWVWHTMLLSCHRWRVCFLQGCDYVACCLS